MRFNLERIFIYKSCKQYLKVLSGEKYDGSKMVLSIANTLLLGSWIFIFLLLKGHHLGFSKKPFCRHMSTYEW
jgi:hypothetical protein